jgi:hypothetical protein
LTLSEAAQANVLSWICEPPTHKERKAATTAAINRRRSADEDLTVQNIRNKPRKHQLVDPAVLVCLTGRRRSREDEMALREGATAGPS